MVIYKNEDWFPNQDKVRLSDLIEKYKNETKIVNIKGKDTEVSAPFFREFKKNLAPSWHKADHRLKNKKTKTLNIYTDGSTKIKNNDEKTKDEVLCGISGAGAVIEDPQGGFFRGQTTERYSTYDYSSTPLLMELEAMDLGLRHVVDKADVRIVSDSQNSINILRNMNAMYTHLTSHKNNLTIDDIQRKEFTPTELRRAYNTLIQNVHNDLTKGREMRLDLDKSLEGQTVKVTIRKDGKKEVIHKPIGDELHKVAKAMLQNVPFEHMARIAKVICTIKQRVHQKSNIQSLNFMWIKSHILDKRLKGRPLVLDTENLKPEDRTLGKMIIGNLMADKMADIGVQRSLIRGHTAFLKDEKACELSEKEKTEFLRSFNLKESTSVRERVGNLIAQSGAIHKFDEDKIVSNFGGMWYDKIATATSAYQTIGEICERSNKIVTKANISEIDEQSRKIINTLDLRVDVPYVELDKALSLSNTLDEIVRLDHQELYKQLIMDVNLVNNKDMQMGYHHLSDTEKIKQNFIKQPEEDSVEPPI